MVVKSVMTGTCLFPTATSKILTCLPNVKDTTMVVYNAVYKVIRCATGVLGNILCPRVSDGSSIVNLGAGTALSEITFRCAWLCENLAQWRFLNAKTAGAGNIEELWSLEFGSFT